MELVVLLKIAALGVLFRQAPWRWIQKRLASFLKFRRPVILVYGLILSLCFVAAAAIPFLASAIVRVLWAAIIVAAVAFDRIYLEIVGQRIDASEAEMLWRERAFAAEVGGGHRRAVLTELAWAVPVLATFVWPPVAPVELGLVFGLLPLAALVAGAGVSAQARTGGILQLPSWIGVPLAFAIAIAGAGRRIVDREPVVYELPLQPRFRKVVLIVDESVRGDYLQVNNAERTSTPFLAGGPTGLVNFGAAAAGHNRSAESRLMLRSGLQPSDIPADGSRAFRSPTIWQYAKRAGFATVNLECSSVVEHSHLLPPESAFIERTIQPSAKRKWLRDEEVARDLLPALLNVAEPAFIQVNKLGVHYPYLKKAPPGFLADSGIEASNDLDDHPGLAEGYRRALRWSVDGFFRVLMERIDLRDTLIVYTSDHGQSLFEGGYLNTHGSTSNVHPGEGNVPMLVFVSEPEFAGRLRAGAEAAYGRSSHFNIFPTLLIAMGYDEEWVTRTYGPSLLSIPESQSPRFLIGDVLFDTDRATWVALDDGGVVRAG